jgi:hypothetical protein
MVAIETYIGRFSGFTAVAGCIVFTALLVWLVGLMIVLRGSRPKERPDIIRAYAMCQPFTCVRSRGTKHASERAALAQADGE